jgi:hypothetical protein
MIETPVDASFVLSAAAADLIPFPVAGEKSILTTSSAETVSTSSAEKPIASVAAEQPVAAAHATEDVAAPTTIEKVGTAPTVKNVVAVLTPEIHSVPELSPFAKGSDVYRLSAEHVVSAAADDHFNVTLD